MPLNKKGKKIMSAMREQYGDEAEAVFYASKNKGTISGVEKKRRGGSLSGGKEFGPPPERGPNPQGLKGGGCPHREVGAKSDIKGISSIQVSGKKFIGIR